ncbi:MAG: patatin family protein [Bacilli bacterium]|nr:patatin family protein [Bacilli bacterium]
MERTGLVLQGGGTRIVFSAGVVDVMMENNIYLPYVIGTSAGAMVAVTYASKNPGTSIEMILKYIDDSRYISLSNFRRYGSVFNFKFFINELISRPEMNFNKQEFNSEKTRMIAVATDCFTGEATYFEKGKCQNIFDGVTASASLPLASKPYQIGDGYYLDGGLSDPVPFQKALNDGNDKVIIIATRDYHFRKKTKVKHRGFLKLMYSNYPKAYKACLNDGKTYNRVAEEIIDLEKAGKALVIRPENPIEISHAEKDVDKLKELYQIGRLTGEKYLKKIQEYINEK